MDLARGRRHVQEELAEEGQRKAGVRQTLGSTWSGTAVNAAVKNSMSRMSRMFEVEWHEAEVGRGEARKSPSYSRIPAMM